LKLAPTARMAIPLARFRRASAHLRHQHAPMRRQHGCNRLHRAIDSAPYLHLVFYGPE
jgi:hypothetical protein